jgi:hypothetical protein
VTFQACAGTEGAGLCGEVLISEAGFCKTAHGGGQRRMLQNEGRCVMLVLPWFWGSLGGFAQPPGHGFQIHLSDNEKDWLTD